MNLLKKSFKYIVLSAIILVIPISFFTFNLYAKSKAYKYDKEVFIDYNYTLAFLELYNGKLNRSVNTYKKILPYLDKERFYKEYISLLIYSRHYNTLVDFLKKSIKKYPKSEEFYGELIDTLIIEGEFNKALKWAKRYKKTFGSNSNLDEKLAVLYMRNKNYDNALKYFKKILNEDRKNPEIYNYIAKCYLNKNEIDKAIKYEKQAIRLDKTVVSYKIFLARLYETKKSYKKAIHIYKNLKINNSIVLSAIGNDYYLSNNTKQALLYFNKAYDKNRNMQIAYKIIYILMDKKEYDKVIRFIGKNRDVVLKDDDIKLTYGLALSKKNQCSKAIQYFLKINKKSKIFKEAIYNTALCYKRLNKKDKAFSILKKYSKKYPEMNFLISDLYIQYKEYNKAIHNIINNMQYIKDKSNAYLYIADTYFTNLKDRDSAVKYLKKSIELDPNNPSSLNYLGYLYIEENIDIDKGIKLVKKALAIKPNSPYYLDSLGWGYYKKHQYKKSLTLLEKAYKEKRKQDTEDNDFVIDLHLANIYYKINKKQKAIHILESILKQSPNNKKAKKLLDKIR